MSVFDEAFRDLQLWLATSMIKGPIFWIKKTAVLDGIKKMLVADVRSIAGILNS